MSSIKYVEMLTQNESHQSYSLGWMFRTGKWWNYRHAYNYTVPYKRSQNTFVYSVHNPIIKVMNFIFFVIHVHIPQTKRHSH